MNKYFKKAQLQRQEFASFCEKIYSTLLDRADDTDRALLQENGVDNWESFILSIHSGETGDPAKEVGECLVQDIFVKLGKREIGSVGQSMEEVLEASKLNKARITAEICSYLRRKYVGAYGDKMKKNRQGKVKDDKNLIIELGGAKKGVDRYKAILFCWYIGYENFDVFKKDINPKKSNDREHNENIISSFSTLFDREQEWVDMSELDLRGKWRVEAQELSVYFSDPANSKQDVLVKSANNNEEVEWLMKSHQKDIRYDHRYSYWGDIELFPTNQKGFFTGEGTLITNTNNDKLDDWTLKLICSIRKSRDTMYGSMDYEMFPKEGVNSPRTFGYCMFQPPSNLDARKRFRGFYFSNRLRDPDKADELDVNFFSSLRISMGRVLLYKPVKK